jgi:hypothetical protein
MKKLDFQQMEKIEGGTDGVGLACAAAGVGIAVASIFTSGFALLLGGGMVTGFCSGWGAASALDSGSGSSSGHGAGGSW